MTTISDGVPAEVIDRELDEIDRHIAEINAEFDFRRRRERRERFRVICLAGAAWEVGVALLDIRDGLIVLIPLAAAVFFLLVGRRYR